MDPSTSTCSPRRARSESRDAAALTDWIRERALALGFARVGVAPVVLEEDAAERLHAWLALGRHGGMRYLEKYPGPRRDPESLLPGARSIVSLAANYFTAAHDPRDFADDRGRGKVSRYAWGSDYHDVMESRATTLLSEIAAAEPGCAGRVAIDTLPLFEKAIAERAGVGWIGKHTNLITQTHGSWVFLGEVLLTIPLAYDAPFPRELCGACTRCLDACPTGALVGAWELDASRCISYATIEHRGPIPETFRGKTDGWLYGCDVCQEVCPWNAAAEETPIPAFHPREAIREMRLDDYAAIDAATFRTRFDGSAMRRARRDGLRRNARFLLEETE